MSTAEEVATIQAVQEAAKRRLAEEKVETLRRQQEEEARQQEQAEQARAQHAELAHLLLRHEAQERQRERFEAQQRIEEKRVAAVRLRLERQMIARAPQLDTAVTKVVRRRDGLQKAIRDMAKVLEARQKELNTMNMYLSMLEDDKMPQVRGLP